MTKQFYSIESIAPLQGNIVAIWSIDSRQPHPITPDLLMPDGYIHLLFVISGGYKRRKLSSAHDQFVVDQSVIIGIQDKVIISQNTGELKCIGIQFDPMQFYLLFGDLGVKACNAHSPISESGQDELIQLNEKISKSASITEALKEIENFFADYSPKFVGCETWQLSKKFLQVLRDNKGMATTELIPKLGEINVNLFNQNFKEFIGFTPKEMTAIVKTTNTFEEHPIHKSASFPSLNDLFKDMDENEGDKL